MQRFSTRLLLGFIILILLTTLSAGIPAYWLTRAQMERLAWSQVTNAQQATQSLLQAEQNRLNNQAVLLSERPTLQKLVREQSTVGLQMYLEAFQSRSDLSLMVFCDTAGTLLAGDLWLSDCARTPGFVLLDNRPALLVTQPVNDGESGERLGMVIAGIWLDEVFLQQLAAATGVQQSILNPDGTPLSSSFNRANVTVETAVSAPNHTTFVSGNNHYNAASASLANHAGQITLISEVALSVDALATTKQQAFFILAGSTGLVAMIGILLSAWYVRQVIAPLHQLTATAKQISQGDLQATIPLFADPIEISTLATALQQSQERMVQTLQERAEASARLNTLVQALVEGVVTFDVSGRITFWSQGAESLLGRTSSEVIGRSINEVFPLANEGADQFLNHIPSAGQKKQIAVLTQTGRSIVLAITGARLIPPGGNEFQVALVVRDVTEEDAVRRLRSYFLGNISHEFRTPLSTLNASLELLLDEEEIFTLAEVRELLQPAYVSLLGLQTLVDNLLESSSIEAGRFTLRKRPFHINQAITNAINIVHPLLKRRSQTLSLAEPSNLPEIEADPTRLTQVLTNLITNASNYSPLGQPIDLQVVQHDNWLRISVADRGPGISAAEHSNLFRDFVRLDTADHEQYGVGLGLYIVKTIVTAHGGHVDVQTRPDGGSIFWFEIPYHEDTHC